MLMRYNCHINVEACCDIKSNKYIYKYIYKGHDNASFSIELGTADVPIEINEVKQYRKARCITVIEAFCRGQPWGPLKQQGKPHLKPAKSQG
jgi:hypothetical protein